MTIHKEGYASIGIATLVFGTINALSVWFLSERYPLIALIIFLLSLGGWLFIISFFRIPGRIATIDDKKLFVPPMASGGH
jgi:phosphatidylserine decarboxylase